MYKHILAAIDLTDANETVGARAIELAQSTGATMSVAHIVEYIPIDPTGEGLLPGALEVTDSLRSEAEARLERWCQQHNLPDIPRLLGTGSINDEIVRLAKEHDCDLIVIGGHERHGLRVLFGSTEDSVRHRAHCDVLAVHLDG